MLTNPRVRQLIGSINVPGQAANAVFLSHDKPVARPVRDRLTDSRLEDAMRHEMGRQRKVVDGTGTDQPLPKLDKVKFKEPSSRREAVEDILLGNLHDYASNKQVTRTPTDGRQPYVTEQITINPNVDEAYLFHELGHIANRQSGLGKAVRDLRDNPDLQKALLGAAVIAPGLVTAATPGDNDTNAALLAAGLTAAPILADEVMASNTALRMMETAGTRATLGQRGRLAGSLMSYLTPAIAAAAVSGTIGNQFD